MLLYVLYEHAAGYTLFRCKEFEEVGMFLPQVESSVTDVTKFKSILQLVGFYPFKTAANALDNINSISEGVVHEDLQLFLETNLPKSGKKSKFSLGVSDTKIGASISELLTVKCLHTGVVPELIRGIRCHFASFVKGFSEQSSGKAQLGLGHSYSRSKVKFNVHRVDNMIIQSISLLDQLDKDVNTFSMRIREWYSYHFPELIKVVPENLMYAKVVRFIKNRKELTEEKLAGLEEIVMDEAKCRAIYDASKMSMGMDISPIDLINIDSFANRVVSLSEYRKKLQDYLKSKMNSVAPNLASLIGDQVGARLISRAGSLTNLAKFPASTVQILGAEKALFRALKTRGNTPKYGLIFHSSFIGRAAAQNKGRISRCLANKCSIASRIDCFTETLSSVFGEKLKEQVEERLRFYETGDVPRKNTVVMKEAIEKALVEKKRMKKEKRKRRLELEKKSMEEGNGNLEEMEEEKEPAEKKKKKKAKRKSSNSFNNSFSNGK